MNHIEAIDAGLLVSKSYDEITRKVFLTYPTKAFVGAEEREFEILNAVSIYCEVPITCVQVVGSAKIGSSIHKNTKFTPGQSDLDLAIINDQLYLKFLEVGVRASRGYADGTVFQKKDGSSTRLEYLRYLGLGIFRPDLMPTGPEKAEWANFFGRLTDKHLDLFKKITCSVYLSQGCFEHKLKSVIKAHATKGAVL